ncbi:YtxH domain-containing protein [Cohnella kolymensis]|uniref:YtxH domain-containing protein n=1 Tax=Cohnella kolymensis TaxID=1590652 RepID=UPI0006965333|nr:YtxH domain-containing protein [Cohnella kolymensis]
MAQTSENKGGMLKGVLIGGAIGAAAGMLFAPKPGRELRGDIKMRYMDAQDRTKQALTDAGAKTSEMVQQVGQQATDIMAKTRSAVTAAKDEVQTWKEEQKNPKDGSSFN